VNDTNFLTPLKFQNNIATTLGDYVTKTTSLTINGLSQDLSTNRTWTIAVTGTSNRISVSGGSGLTPTIDIAATYTGQTSITTLGTITTGTWNAGAITSSGAITGISLTASSLTSGFIPRASAAGLLVNGVIRDDGTTIGIGGVPLSSYMLSLYGSMNLQGYRAIDFWAADATLNTWNNSGAIWFNNSTGTRVGGILGQVYNTGSSQYSKIQLRGRFTDVYLTIDGQNQRVGIFNDSPSHAFDITANTRIVGNVGIGIAPDTTDILTVYKSTFNRTTFLTDQDVQVGLKLQRNKTGGSLNAIWEMFIYGTSSDLSIYSGAVGDVIRMSAAGKVGVAVAPHATHRLSIDGNIFFAGNPSSTGNYLYNASGNAMIGWDSATLYIGLGFGSAPIHMGTSSTGKFRWRSTGNFELDAAKLLVNSNTDLGAYNLQVTGAGRFSSGSNYISFTSATVPEITMFTSGLWDGRITANTASLGASKISGNSFKFYNVSSAVDAIVHAGSFYASNIIESKGGILWLTSSTDNFVGFFEAGAAARGVMGYADGSSTFQVRVNGASNMSDGTLALSIASTGAATFSSSITAAGIIEGQYSTGAAPISSAYSTGALLTSVTSSQFSAGARAGVSFWNRGASGTFLYYSGSGIFNYIDDAGTTRTLAAPQNTQTWTALQTFSSGISATSITASGLTAGRTVYTGAGGLLSASANNLWDNNLAVHTQVATLSGNITATYWYDELSVGYFGIIKRSSTASGNLGLPAGSAEIVASSSTAVGLNLGSSSNYFRIGYSSTNSVNIFGNGNITTTGTILAASDIYANTRISLGGSSFVTWASGLYTMQGVSGINSIMLASNATSGVHITTNAYHNGSNWKYVAAAAAANMSTSETGLLFRVAPVGTAGADVSWVNALSVGLTGYFTYTSSAASGSYVSEWTNTNTPIKIKFLLGSSAAQITNSGGAGGLQINDTANGILQIDIGRIVTPAGWPIISASGNLLLRGNTSGTAGNGVLIQSFHSGDWQPALTILNGSSTSLFSGSTTASSSVARGVYMNQTLVQAAASDVLSGLDINTTFNVGAGALAHKAYYLKVGGSGYAPSAYTANNYVTGIEVDQLFTNTHYAVGIRINSAYNNVQYATALRIDNSAYWAIYQSSTSAMNLIAGKTAFGFSGGAYGDATHATATTNGATINIANDATYGAIKIGTAGFNTQHLLIHHTESGSTHSVIANTYNNTGSLFDIRMKGNTAADAVIRFHGTTAIGFGMGSVAIPTISKYYFYNNATSAPLSTFTQLAEFYHEDNNAGGMTGGRVLFKTKNSTGAHGNFYLDFKHQGVNASANSALIWMGQIGFNANDGATHGSGTFNLKVNDGTAAAPITKLTIASNSMTFGSYGGQSVFQFFYTDNQSTEQTFTVVRTGNSGWIGQHIGLRGGAAFATGTNLNGGNVVLRGGTPTGSGSSNVEVYVTGGGASGTTDNTSQTLIAQFKGSNKGTYLSYGTSNATHVGYDNTTDLSTSSLKFGVLGDSRFQGAINIRSGTSASTRFIGNGNDLEIRSNDGSVLSTTIAQSGDWTFSKNVYLGHNGAGVSTYLYGSNGTQTPAIVRIGGGASNNINFDPSGYGATIYNLTSSGYLTATNYILSSVRMSVQGGVTTANTETDGVFGFCRPDSANGTTLLAGMWNYNEGAAWSNGMGLIWKTSQGADISGGGQRYIRMILTAGGTLQIGYSAINTGSTTHKLDVNGSAQIVGTTYIGSGTSGISLSQNSGNGYIAWNATTEIFRLWRTGGNRLMLSSAAGVNHMGYFKENLFYYSDSLGSGVVAPSEEASALIQLDSVARGVLLPRMTNAQRGSIASPATGLLAYSTDATEGLYVKLSGGWQRFLTTADTISISEPANQIVYGTGAGADSSANFTWDPTSGAFQINDSSATYSTKWDGYSWSALEYAVRAGASGISGATLAFLGGGGGVQGNMYVANTSGNSLVVRPNEISFVKSSGTVGGYIKWDNITGAFTKTIQFPDASGTLALTSDIPTATSGTYTPTLTGIANVTTVAIVGTANYMRVGNTVTVSGYLQLDHTINATATSFRMSLPVASNFSSSSEAGGAGASRSLNLGHAVAIRADATNDQALFELKPPAGAGSTDEYTFTFTYRII
jgi:hypothetical protein